MPAALLPAGAWPRRESPRELPPAGAALPSSALKSAALPVPAKLGAAAGLGGAATLGAAMGGIAAAGLAAGAGRAAAPREEATAAGLGGAAGAGCASTCTLGCAAGCAGGAYKTWGGQHQVWSSAWLMERDMVLLAMAVEQAAGTERMHPPIQQAPVALGQAPWWGALQPAAGSRPAAGLTGKAVQVPLPQQPQQQPRHWRPSGSRCCGVPWRSCRESGVGWAAGQPRLLLLPPWAWRRGWGWPPPAPLLLATRAPPVLAPHPCCSCLGPPRWARVHAPAPAGAAVVPAVSGWFEVRQIYQARQHRRLSCHPTHQAV